MAQPSFSAVRQALAATLTARVINPDGSGLRASPNRNAAVNPPQAVIMPAVGAFASYSLTFSGSLQFLLRIILLVAEGDSTSGQDNIDPYIATTGTQSIWAAVQADPRLSNTVEDAFVVQATNYGLISWAGIDYLGAHFIVQVMA